MLAAVGLVAVASGLAFVLDRYSTGADLAMIFLASVLVRRPGLRPEAGADGRGAGDRRLQFLLPRAAVLASSIGHATDVFTFAIFIAVAGRPAG